MRPPAGGAYGAGAVVFGKPVQCRRGPRHCDRELCPPPPWAATGSTYLGRRVATSRR